MIASTSDTMIVIVLLTIRLVVPLFIPRFPLPAILIALVVDAADQSVLQQLTDFDLDNYQNFDKALDIYYLAIAYLSVFRNWTNTFAIQVAAFLWYYRLVGVLLFEIFDQRWLLLVFPNTFEYFFIAYCVIQTCWDPRRVSNRGIVGLAGAIWIFIKLPQEWWIHVAQLDFTDFMKETIFGVDADSSWSEAISNRPGVLVAIILAIVAIVAVALRMRRRLPERDWTFGLDMDRTDPSVRRSDPVPTSMRAAIIEKVALIGLVGAIFANVLNVDTSGVNVVGATFVIVAATAGLSVWLARRGIAWASLAVEFIVLAAVTTALLVAYAAIIGGSRLERPTALFFGLLLTVLIVLYDRYRPTTPVDHGA